MGLTSLAGGIAMFCISAGRLPAYAFAALLTAFTAFAQEQGPPAEPPGGGGGAGAGANIPPGGGGGGGFPSNTPGNVPGNTGRFPGDNRNQTPFPDQNRQQFPEMQRPIFLSGKVTMEDGSPPPESVVIERVCNGIHRAEDHTDSKGRFSIQLGQNRGLMQDASVSSATDGFGTPGLGTQSRGAGGPMGGGISERDLMGCELRASLPGYQSSIVNLSGRRVMDNPDVGTIFLKKLGNVEGTTISITSQLAPKDARKAYEKGRELASKKRIADARKEFEKAVAVYPKYAVAWNDLGLIMLAQSEKDKARDAFAKALEADNKFIKPYLQLALLSAGEQKWQDVADTTGRIIRLNPVDFPEAFFYNAVANYNLQKFDDAEKSAAEAVKLDLRHRLPKAQHVLGVLMAMREDFQGAAENMRGYLKYAPQATDADMVKNQLTEIEKRLGQTEVVQKQDK
jgi:tetratricopeptide (TPR) repeat protein